MACPYRKLVHRQLMGGCVRGLRYVDREAVSVGLLVVSCGQVVSRVLAGWTEVTFLVNFCEGFSLVLTQPP